MAVDDTRASYRGVLSVREFRALFVAQIVSVLGNVVAMVALAVLVYDRTHSSLLSALTFTLGFTPFLVSGTLLAGVVDRLPARRTLVCCDLISAATVGAMVLPLPIPVLLVLIFAAGLVDPVFAGVRAAILPDMLGTGPSFVLGRAMFSMVWQGAQVVGYAAGGLLLAAVSPRGALAIDAVSFLFSALIVRTRTAARPAVAAEAAPDRADPLRESWRSIRTVWSDAEVRRLLLLHWLLPACALAPEALIAPYVHVLGGPQRDVGLLLCAIATGMLTANLLAARLLTPRWQRRLIGPIALLNVVTLVGFVAPGGFGVGVVLMALIGVGSCYSLGRDSLLIEATPQSLRARTLAIDSTGLMVVQGLGFALWGALAEFLSVRTTIGVAGLAGTAALALLLRRRPSVASTMTAFGDA